MIEVKILKSRHATEEEARKLRPYIEDCDFFAPEAMGMSNYESTISESRWRNALSWTRSRFSKMNSVRYSELPINQEIYAMKRDDMLFRNKKNLWFVERFFKGESRDIKQKMRDFGNQQKRALFNLIEGNKSYFLREFPKSQKILMEIARVRDVHIAKNIGEAEEKIREFYGFEHYNVKLTVDIGSGHSVEDYLGENVNYEVIPLFGEMTSGENLLRGIKNKIYRLEDVSDRELLAYGISLIDNKTVFEYEEERLLDYNIDELNEIVEKRIA